MKKVLILIFMMLLSGAFINTYGQGKPDKNTKIFMMHSDECFAVMENTAQEMSVNGASVLVYIPGDVSESWISKMKVVGALQNGSANFLAIAYTKAAEMADTFTDSGSGVREPMHGEFGYQGGLIKKISSGYIMAVFSGASGEQDAAIAKSGLDLLSTFF